MLERFKKTLAGSAIIFFGYVVGTSLDFLVRVIPARLLPVDEYGLFVLAISILNISAIVGMVGLRYGVARNLAVVDDQQKLFMTALAVAGVTSLLTLSTLLISQSALMTHVIETENNALIIIIACTVPFAVLQRVLVGAFNGIEDARSKTILRNVVERSAIFGFVILGILLGYASMGAVTGWAAGVIMTSIFGVFYIHRKTDLLSANAASRISLDSMKRILLFSLPLMVADAVWRIIQEIDKLLIGYFLQTHEVGIYDAAFTLSKGSMVFLWTFMFMFLPQFSRLYDGSDQEKMDTYFKTVSRWVAAAGLPPLLILVIYPEQVLGLVFGSAYELGANALIILSMGYMSYMLFGLGKPALTATGYVRFIMISSVAILILNVLLNIGLIPRLGIEGAAVATAAAFVLSNAGFISYIYLEEKVHPFSMNLIKMTTYTISVVTAIFIFAITFTPSHLWHLVALTVGMYAIHAVSFFASGLTDIERHILQEGQALVRDRVLSRLL